jgi:hypothetical protein
MNDAPLISESPPKDELATLRALVEGTARHTGQEFFQSLVRNLAAAVGTRFAFIAEFAGVQRVRSLAFWYRDRIVPRESRARSRGSARVTRAPGKRWSASMPAEC